MEKLLTIQTIDGKSWQIMVLDTFSVDEYPEKNYVAYTFGEEANPEFIKSYISILNENENYYTLDEMADEEEKRIVKEAYQNMLLESGEL